MVDFSSEQIAPWQYISNVVCRYNLPCYGRKKNPKTFLRALAVRILSPGRGHLIPLTTGKSSAGSTGLQKQILA